MPEVLRSFEGLSMLIHRALRTAHSVLPWKFLKRKSCVKHPVFFDEPAGQHFAIRSRLVNFNLRVSNLRLVRRLASSIGDNLSP